MTERMAGEARPTLPRDEPLKWVSVHAEERLQLVRTQAALD